MSEQINKQAIEQRSYEYVPLTERKGEPKQLFFTWFTASTLPITLITGALAIIIGLNFWWSVLAMFMGHAIGAFIMSAHSAQGPKLGIPQLMQSKAQFGHFGVILPMLITLVTYFGYGATNTIIIGQGIEETLGVNINLTIFLCMIPMVLLAIYGQGLIQKSMRLYAISYTIIFMILSIMVISQLSMSVLNAGEFSLSSFFIVLSICITWQLTYSIYVSDHSRNMHPKDAKKVFFYTYFGSFLSSFWLMVLGAAIATMAVNGNVINQMKEMGALGFTIVILVTLGILVVNTLNIYGAGIISLSIASTFIKFKTTVKMRIITTVIIGIVMVLAATVGAENFMANFQLYLEFILFFIVPWSIINLTDFYLLKRQNYQPDDFMTMNGTFKSINTKTLIIYIITVICQIPFVNTQIFQGPVSRSLNDLDIAWIVGAMIAFVLYYLVSKNTKVPQQSQPLIEKEL